MGFEKPQEYLESISDATLLQYLDMGKVWRCWYVYPPLLHEIAAKSPDELHELCPELERENAFEARSREKGGMKGPNVLNRIVNHSIQQAFGGPSKSPQIGTYPIPKPLLALGGLGFHEQNA